MITDTCCSNMGKVEKRGGNWYGESFGEGEKKEEQIKK